MGKDDDNQGQADQDHHQEDDADPPRQIPERRNHASKSQSEREEQNAYRVRQRDPGSSAVQRRMSLRYVDFHGETDLLERLSHMLINASFLHLRDQLQHKESDDIQRERASQRGARHQNGRANRANGNERSNNQQIEGDQPTKDPASKSK